MQAGVGLGVSRVSAQSWRQLWTRGDSGEDAALGAGPSGGQSPARPAQASAPSSLSLDVRLCRMGAESGGAQDLASSTSCPWGSHMLERPTWTGGGIAECGHHVRALASRIHPSRLHARLCVSESTLPAMGCEHPDVQTQPSLFKFLWVLSRVDPGGGVPASPGAASCVSSINCEGDKALSVFCKRYSLQMISLPPQP